MKFIILLSLVFSATLYAREKCNFICIEIPDSHEWIEKFGQSQKHELSDSIRVSIWNIYKSSKKEWATEFSEVTQRSDIVLLQEVLMDNGHYENQLLIEGFDNHFANSFFMKDGQRTGVGTLSRSHTFHSKAYRTRDKEPLVGSYKMSLMTSYLVKGWEHPLVVINIHGINFTSAQALYNQVSDILMDLKNYDGPLLFGGDFNTRNKKRQKMIDDLMTEHGLKQVALKHDMRKKKLDHVYTRMIHVQHAELIGNLKGSDHPAIYLEIQP